MTAGSQVRVVLADPPLRATTTDYALDFPNLGLLYLASTLRRSFVNPEIHYLDCRLDLEAHVRKIAEIRPDVYGLSFASFFAARAYRTIGLLRQACPELFIVCGGAHPSAAPVEVLTQSPADVCCIGEGETTFLEIVQSRFARSDFRQIDGIAYRSPGGGVQMTPPRALIEPIDDIAFPAWDLVDFNHHPGCRKARGRPSTALCAGRGCPFKCTFCSNPVWRIQKPSVRTRSPENIAAEIEVLYARGIREIYLVNDEMNPSHDWCVAVFDRIGKLGHKDLFFQCKLRAVPVTDELASSLRSANCWLVHLGIESASARVLRGIKKSVTREDVVMACRTLKRHGIRVYAFMMMFNAWIEDGRLQSESLSEVFQSLRFALSLRLQGLIALMSWAYATPLPSSELHEIALEHRLLRKGAAKRGISSFHDVSLAIPGVSRGSMLLARAAGMLLQYVLFFGSLARFTRGNLAANSLFGFKKALRIIRPW